MFGPRELPFQNGMEPGTTARFALTNWLLDSGESVARKYGNLDSLEELTSSERLLYEASPL